MCACGCGAELKDSLYWATEICHIRWLSRRNRTEQVAVGSYLGTPWAEPPLRDD